MLITKTHAGAAENSRLKRIIERLRRADPVQLVGDRRLAQRLPFVRPVRITIGRCPKTEIMAISNNLSQLGIGLMHDVAIEVGRIGILTIYRERDEILTIRAESRWRETFCDSWFISGWRFLAEERR